MSHVISLRLKDSQLERLRRLAKRWGRTPSETSVLLLEETLRTTEFAYIQFRDSPVGRQAYIIGTSLAVWEVAMLSPHFNGDAERLATHLAWPVAKVRATFNYATAYPEEIATAIAENDVSLDDLSRLVPSTQIFPAAEH